MEPREDPEDPEEDEEIHDLNWATGHPSQDEEANVNEILRFEEGLEELKSDIEKVQPKVIVACGFSTNKAMLKVSVDNTCRLRGFGTITHCPCSGLFGANCEKCNKVQEVITSANNLRQASFA